MSVEDDPITKKVAKESIKLFKSDARFAEYVEKYIQVRSIGGSHTIHLMAAVDQERSSDRSSINNKAGKLNNNLFCANADFRHGIEVGNLGHEVAT